MVEFALVVPFLLLLFLGIIEFGIIVFRYNSVSSLAREGARYGIVHPVPADIQTYTYAKGAELGLVPTPLEVAVPSIGSGYVTVAITYTHSLVTGPFLSIFGVNPTIPLASVARMRTEQ